jgi:TPR repeat protein
MLCQGFSFSACLWSLALFLALQPFAVAQQAQTGQGVIGISIQGKPQGMLVTDVIPGGPADHAGLRQGDIIIQAGDVRGNATELTERIYKQPVGVPLKITFLRGETQMSVDVSTVDRVSLYKRAASEGSPAAQAALGDLYVRGYGVTKDIAQGVGWYRKGAEQGYAEAEYKLGWAYFHGQGVAKDQAEGGRWIRKAAEQGNAAAEADLGLAYFTGEGLAKDQAEGVRWFRKAAEQGDASGENRLGFAYDAGQGIHKDLAESIRWYRKAADQGEAMAQYSLGLAYVNGQGVSKDVAEGVRWYRKAAEQGYADAENNLGSAYYNGSGVPKDAAEGVHWYRKAAEQGEAVAESNLGLAYYNGSGVPVDDIYAYMWFSLAAEQGNENAKKNLKLDRMKRLGASERAEAERRASSWKAYLNRTTNPDASGIAAEQSGRPREALDDYIQALQSMPEPTPPDADRRIRERIMKVVAQLNPPPALPQDAIRHAAYAQAAVEEAQKDGNPSHLTDAVNELQSSLRIAPWWAEGYFNLGSALKKAQRPGEAAQALELYLLADPNAQNAQDIQMEIYKLQYQGKQQ